MNVERSKQYGQYSTPVDIADFMIGLSTARKSAPVLDPGCGSGVFIERLARAGYANIVGYEIDREVRCGGHANVIYRSFVSDDLDRQFELVIGNPPYVRWKNLERGLKAELEYSDLWKRYCNSLCDYSAVFILKAAEVLKEQGELIFITPEYWITTQHSRALRDYMARNGYFQSIYHFNETPIFPKVASSIVIFKYIKSTQHPEGRQDRIRICKYYSKSRLDKDALDLLKDGKLFDGVEYFEIDQFQAGRDWHLIPDSMTQKLARLEEKCTVRSLFLDGCGGYDRLGDIADIGNGLVSGLDKAFQLSRDIKLNEDERRATIKVLKAKNIRQYVHGETTDYVFTDGQINEAELATKYPNFVEQLSRYRSALENRYNYNREIKYWEWVFLRSYQLFARKQSKIFVPCKERISHKNYLRFAYVEPEIYPTQDVTAILLKNGTRESIYYVLALLNSDFTFEWLKHKGVVKGNIVEFCDRPLSVIPIRMINWNSEDDVTLHDMITALCRDYIRSRDEKILADLRQAVGCLF